MRRVSWLPAPVRGLIASALLAPAALAAQEAGRAPVAEVRATVPTADWPAGEVGAGLGLRLGWYVRASALVYGGALRTAAGDIGTARAEAAVRFHLDPFNQARGCGWQARGGCRGLYGGMGVSQRWRAGVDGAEVPVFVLIVGIEGDAAPRRGPLVWGMEAALGGGLRLGLSARWRRPDGYR